MLMLIWYRTKVLGVLREHFGYDPAVPGHQSDVFNEATKAIRKAGGNEFDAAIAFMFVQLELLSNDSSTLQFRRKLINDARFCSQHAKLDGTKQTAIDLASLYRTAL